MTSHFQARGLLHYSSEGICEVTVETSTATLRINSFPNQSLLTFLIIVSQIAFSCNASPLPLSLSSFTKLNIPHDTQSRSNSTTKTPYKPKLSPSPPSRLW